MLFIPSKPKYRKQQKGKSTLRINKNISFSKQISGSILLKATTAGFLTSNEVKTLRQTIQKALKKRGRLKLNIYPQTPVTKKPLEIRMGKGKGAVDHWIFKVRPGMILLEVETEFILPAIRSLKLAQIRLSVHTKIVY